MRRRESWYGRAGQNCRCIVALIALVAWASIGPRCLAADPDATFSAEQLEFFEKQVRPLLVEHCFECHSGEGEDTTKGGLRLDSRDGALTGGDTGPAIVAHKPRESLLIDAVNYGELYQMPPKSKLAAEEIAVLERWVELGAPWTPTTREATDGQPAWNLEALKQSHWAWQPLSRPASSTVQDLTWARDPLDQYVLAQLEQHQLTPAADAPPLVWLRRVYFDLIGLPPSPDEVRAFAADHSDAARAAVVDRLLRSPRFGERWARHWLDLVRYAESRGHEFDYDVANAYQYRDYVIRALNADVPYDQFMTEHVAGDLLAAPRLHPTEGYNESILGTGFWFLGEWVHSPVDIRKDECDRFDNMVDVFSKTFLGLTVACARCHDHKFDAISQRDYYALFGYLQSTAYRQVPFETLEANRAVARDLAAHDRATSQSLAALWRQAQQPVLQRLPDYMLAARSVLQATPAAERSSPETREPMAAALAAETQTRVERIAAEHDLHPQVLARWVLQLLRAADQPDDPLWLWAQLSLRDMPVGELFDSWSSRRAHHPRPAGAEMVVDFSTATDEQWLADGFAFGSGPVRPGDWLGAVNASSHPFRVATFGAARRDGAWRGLALRPGTSPEPGRLGAWMRAGQSVRTLTFEIQPGRVHYLVRGSGVAYAAVDSHTLINGPLHGTIVHEFKEASPSDQWRWVTHDLGRYRGHRTHIEFFPLGDEPLEIYMVVQAGEVPALPTASPAAALAGRLAHGVPTELVDIAAIYQQVLADSAARFGDQGSATGDAVAEASLLAWMVARPELFNIEAETLAAARWNDYRAARERIAAGILRSSATAPAMWEGSGEDEQLLIRGNPKTPGEAVPRGMLTAIAGAPRSIPHGSGRLELAKQLTDPANPFPSRVMVNRVWHHLMGRGIVASTDNFGVLGEAPTHPELLDHLATSFQEEGWSLKELIRRIVLSSTYRMASTPRPEAEAVDPQNRLLHRMRIRRLEGEAIRDSLLAVAGRLDTRMYGTSVPVYLTPFMQGRGRPAESGPLDGKGRRSVYIAVRRNFLSPMMLAFDTPQPFSSVGRRSVSNVPAQALILLNDPLVTELARAFAERTLELHPASIDEMIQQMYVAAYARRAAEAEVAAARAFLVEAAAAHGQPADALLSNLEPWAELAHVLFNVKEFIFVL